MKQNLQSAFDPRQYMVSRDFEIYYYNDRQLSRVQSHTHDYYEFYFFLEGEVSIFIEEKQHLLRSGDVVLIPPGIQHYVTVHTPEIPYRRFVFWISREFSQRLMELSADYGYLLRQPAASWRYIFHYDIISFNALQSKVFSLIEELHSDRFGRAAKISLCVNDLILHLNRTAYEAAHPSAPREEQQLYQNLIQYIEGHIEEKLTLEQLAGEFYVNKYHISHVFKENLGLSVHQYILKKRLELCRDAIRNNSRLGEIYLLYGFQDYSSFYRAFKKEFGISPSDYKKECRDPAETF